MNSYKDKNFYKKYLEIMVIFIKILSSLKIQKRIKILFIIMCIKFYLTI